MHRTFPKPEPRKRVKARKDRAFAKARKACREVVYARVEGKCQRCQKPLYLNPSDEGADWYNVANINEMTPRSLGGDSTDPESCDCLCARCHTGSGRHRARVA